MASLEKFFALSTCIHCRNTREFFEQNNVEINPIYIDKLEGDEREAHMEEMSKYNSEMTFPTLVFSDGTVIVGFRRAEISKELDL